jgi:hypothetical protein
VDPQRRGAAGAVPRDTHRTTPSKGGRAQVHADQLKIKQTATGYWIVERGAVQLAGGMTRSAAEAERDLVNQLRGRSVRRLRGPQTAPGRRLREVRDHERR